MTSKRTFNEIRNEIQKALKKRPMNRHEISNDTGINPQTVKRHLEYLEDVGAVKQASFNLRKGEEKLWVTTKRVEL